MVVSGHRALLGFVALALVSCAGEPAAKYARAATPEHGSAPGMRVQRLNDDGHDRRYAIVFAPGDEILGGLTDFAEQEHIGAARLTGIGGVHDATLGFFDREKKLFREIPIDTQAEVTSLVGDIARLEDHPAVHVHMNVALADGTVHGGHLLRAHVWPTLEVMLTESPRALRKEHVEDMGLDLIVPDGSR